MRGTWRIARRKNCQTVRNVRLNYRQYAPGHIMENIIYNEPVKRDYSVDAGIVTERKKDERIPPLEI